VIVLNKRQLIALAREMRHAPTRSEDMFWQAVRNRRLDGVKFRRQQVITPFIVDFFVPSHRLVIEIDGGVHEESKESDALREQFLSECGLQVLRVTDFDVERGLEGVLETVRDALKK